VSQAVGGSTTISDSGVVHDPEHNILKTYTDDDTRFFVA
jgi:hypothetical protein